MKILITGATGLVGKAVGKALYQKGHEIFIVTRDSEIAKKQIPFPCEVIEGDLSEGSILHPRFINIDAVIHLMGESVGDGRWTEERKKRILDSRVKSTHFLYESLKENKKLVSMISASAVGYYGDCGDEEINEASKPETENQDNGASFLKKVCRQWEEAVIADLKAKFPSVRDVIFRCGVVLSRNGGALPKMMLPLQKGIGAPLGSGNQWISWIHIDDLVQLYVCAIEDSEYQGIYNACAPHPVTNAEFTSRLAHVMNKKFFPVPVPGFILKMALGEMATLVLGSQRVIPQRLLSQGFRFQFNELDVALRDLCNLKLLNQAFNQKSRDIHT